MIENILSRQNLGCLNHGFDGLKDCTEIQKSVTSLNPWKSVIQMNNGMNNLKLLGYE